MLDVTVIGLEDTIKNLNSLGKTLPTRMKILVMRLTAEGYSVARAAFASAYYAGTNDVVVDTPAWEGDRLVLRAKGEAVAFIEFGTGVTYAEYPAPEAYTKLPLAGRGQYGKGKGSNPEGWTYVGDPGNAGEVVAIKKNGNIVVKTKGNPPARAMFDAGQIMASRQRAVEIAREIFNDRY